MGGSIVYIILMLFFLGGAIYTGYIVEQAFLVVNALVYIGFFLVLIRRRSVTVTWLHLPIGLYVACYWVACINAVDFEAALLEASRVSSLIPLSLMATMLAREKLTKLLFIWPWIGSFLVFIGIAFQLEREGRLESTLQYANALALILLAGILISMLSFAKAPSNLQLILLIINAVGLLLTFSRSVWILWLISAAAAILLIPQLRTKKSMIYVAACHLASLIIAMVIKQDVLFFLNRVASIQTKTSEFQIRLVYWKDSFQMFMDYMWGGTGGGGWTVLQYAYQSQQYFVKFIHNHYVQVFLDIGLIGGLCWLAVIAVFVKNGLPLLKSVGSAKDVEDKGLFIIITVMLLHAGFDFDLIFPLILTLLISLMLLMPQKVMALEVKGVKLAAAGTAAIIAAFFFGWMAAGYHWKEQAVRAVRANDLGYAQEQLKRAESAIPWSSSILYESAKIYVRMGNDSGDPSDYELAEGELLKAKQMVPEQKLYTDLLESINKNE
jgi:O-antigen ligase